MTIIRLSFLWALFIWLCGISANAHEIRPAALELTEQSGGTVAVVWKQPILSGRKLKMRPVLPDQCPAPETTRQVISGDAIVERWQVSCQLDKGRIMIEGLDRTLTDVFVRLSTADGEEDYRIFCARPVRLLPWAIPVDPLLAPICKSVQSICCFGWDHLLFVLGLLLLTPVRKLLWVITAFTLGHSITLAITALGLFSLPSKPVELLIALSIFFLAVEVVRKWAGKTSLTICPTMVDRARLWLAPRPGFRGGRWPISAYPKVRKSGHCCCSIWAWRSDRSCSWVPYWRRYG